jgi:hypothetical protein
MSVESVMARVDELRQLVDPRARPTPPPTSNTNFAQQLSVAQGIPAALRAAGTANPAWQPALTGAPLAAGATATTTGAQRVALAAAELGVTEAPPGSNDSPRIAQYRQAMQGNPGVGPWCAYFVSWVSQQAGAPLGEVGQGFASVDAVYAWAQRTGRAIPNSPAAPATPQAGDLIVWDEHIGVVESVDPDGTVHTIEGNSSNMVARRTHEAGSALGYVRMG